MKEEKILEGGYTIERGSEKKQGTSQIDFSKNPSPSLTKTKKGVKKKKIDRRNFIIPKHRVVLEELEKNGGQITKAMIAASYSEKYALGNATGLTRSDSWQNLMEEYLPSDKVALRHSELLDKRARRNIHDDKGNIIEYGVDDGPDTAAVTKAIEMAYKLRGAYNKAESPKEASITYNLFYKPGVQENVKAFEQQLIREIYHDVDKEKAIEMEEAEAEDDESGEGGD
jgi:hypothetical protein